MWFSFQCTDLQILAEPERFCSFTMHGVVHWQGSHELYTVHMQNNVKRLGHTHTLLTVRVKDIRTQLPKPQLDTISCHDEWLMCNLMLSWLQSLLYSPLCIHKKISFGRSMILVKELFNYFTQVCLYSMMIKFCYLRCSAFFRTDNFAATQG